MKLGTAVWAAIAAAGVVVCAQRAQAATMTVLNDTGDVEAVIGSTYSRVHLTNLYGTSPVVPAVTQTSATSYEIDFAPTSGFSVSAYARPYGQTTNLDGSLDIVVTFASPVQLSTTIYEDGIYLTSGTGTVNAYAGVTVWAVNPETLVKLSGPKPGLFNNPTFLDSGMWTLSGQAGGFSDTHLAYMIHIDNNLMAQALLPDPGADGTAWIAKKDFTLVLTDESGGGGVPEPASLGVLALGALTLLARRRRA
jgi:hypothetical protein